MRKILTSFAFIAASLTFAQVGVNNEDPKATLHIDAKEKAGASTIKDGILIPRVDRQRAENMVGVEESTLIYIDNENAGNKTGQAANIDEKGFYYFKGGVWVKLGGGAAAPATGKAQTWREFRMAPDAVGVEGGVHRVSSNDETIPETAFLTIMDETGNTTLRLPDASNFTAGKMIVISNPSTGNINVVDHTGKSGGKPGSQLVTNGRVFYAAGRIFITDGVSWYAITQ